MKNSDFKEKSRSLQQVLFLSIYKKRITIVKKQEKIAKTSAKLLLLARWKRKIKRML